MNESEKQRYHLNIDKLMKESALANHPIEPLYLAWWEKTGEKVAARAVHAFACGGPGREDEQVDVLKRLLRSAFAGGGTAALNQKDELEVTT